MFFYTPEYADNLEALFKNRDAIIMDFNGILYSPTTNEKYEQANEVIEKAKKMGIPTYIMSNSTSDATGIKKRLEEIGHFQGKDYQDILTAGETFRSALIDEPVLLAQNIDIKNHKIYAVGHMFDGLLKDTNFSTTNNPEEADFAYLGIPQLTTLEYEKLSDKQKEGFAPSNIIAGNWDVKKDTPEAAKIFFEKKMANLNMSLINANQDSFVDEFIGGKPITLIRQKYFADMYENAGNDVIKIGKHYPYMFKIMVNRIRADTQKVNPNIAYLGDNLSTDIRGIDLFKQKGKLVDKQSLIDAQSVSVLCLNDYWANNDANLKLILEKINNKDLSARQGKEQLSKYVGKIGTDAGIVPDNIRTWTTNRGIR